MRAILERHGNGDPRISAHVEKDGSVWLTALGKWGHELDSIMLTAEGLHQLDLLRGMNK